MSMCAGAAFSEIAVSMEVLMRLLSEMWRRLGVAFGGVVDGALATLSLKELGSGW